MSHPAPNTSLSLSARLLCYLGPPSAILLTSIASPRTAILSPLAFLPTAWFYKKWRKSNSSNPSRRGELESIIWTYAIAGTLGLTTVALFQLGILKAASALLFGSKTAISKDFWEEFGRSTISGLTADHVARRAQLASSWQNWVFNGVMMFIGAGLGEEILKYLPIAYARRRDIKEQRQQGSRAYLDYALAGALSFGLIENIGFLHTACKPGQEETWPKLILTLFERLVIGQIGHLSMGALTALRAIRRDYYGDPLTLWQVVGPAILYHGTFDYVVISASALEGNVGWIHPTSLRITSVMFGIATGLVASAVWQVKQEWQVLEEQDRLAGTSGGNSDQK